MTEINPTITQPNALVPAKNNTNFKAANTMQTDNDIDTLMKQQEKARKSAKAKDIAYYTFLGTMILGTIAGVYYMRQQSPGKLEKNVNELKEIWADLTNSSKIDDMALPDGLKKFISSFKNSVENPEILKQRGGKPTKSLLLYGPPGTGKTTFAKALAKEFPDSKFASLDVTSLGSEYQSVSERNLNKAVDMICKDAAENPNKKYFVFIDEIDSVMMVDNSLSAKHSNDMLNEFKKCFTEKLGKHDNIITIGATNLPIDIEKGVALGGKKLDRPMLDRFSEKVLVGLPTGEQIVNSVKHHYKDCSLVSDALKTDSKELKAIANFLSNPENNTSFRTLDSIYDAAASSVQGNVKKVEVMDVLKTIKSKKHELNYNEANFSKLLSDLKVDPAQV